MKKIACFLLFLSALIMLLSSCGERRSARDALSELSAALGGGGVIYTADAREGEAGYIDGEFFSLMFGEDFSFSGDYAVWLNSNLEEICEAGVFACESSYSAEMVKEMLRERIRLVGSVISSSSIDAPEGALWEYGNTVVYYIGEGRERIGRILQSVF